MGKRVTTHDIRSMKARGEPIPMITAYDFTSAMLADRAGVPIILVGDSLGQVVLGYDSTIPVSLDDMVRATSSVVRGAPRPLIVADMPFMTYQESPEQAISWQNVADFFSAKADLGELVGRRRLRRADRQLAHLVGTEPFLRGIRGLTDLSERLRDRLNPPARALAAG